MGSVDATGVEPWLPQAAAVFQNGRVVPGFALPSRESRILCSLTKDTDRRLSSHAEDHPTKPPNTPPRRPSPARPLPRKTKPFLNYTRQNHKPALDKCGLIEGLGSLRRLPSQGVALGCRIRALRARRAGACGERSCWALDCHGDAICVILSDSAARERLVCGAHCLFEAGSWP